MPETNAVSLDDPAWMANAVCETAMDESRTTVTLGNVVEFRAIGETESETRLE